ncbi:MAG: class I SAM-dependent RNA methyltransferase [Spirochaetaceae bacterium]|jgi:putative N6-adenine-specific DNA methylase|nr:class I SAM-dependent RNA methyltransferase [Spirochaetaceae bacterium]
MQKFTVTALCAAGAEKVVSNELKKLVSSPPGTGNYAVLESGFGKVRFTTDREGLYRALMSLRAADRLLLEAGVFPAAGFDELFEGTRNIAWEQYIPRGMGLKVSKVRTSRSKLAAETSVQAVVHKAAAERLCGHYGIRRLPEPEVLPGGRVLKPAHGTLIKPAQGIREKRVLQAELRVYLEKDRASLLLDLSGPPLFKRGYRPSGGTAPLRETAAAAIILLSGWRRKFPLYDPLCGSGTIVIEAALYAWDQAPGLGRSFALSDLAIGDKKLEADVRGELAEKADYGRTVRIYGSDADEGMAALAQTNLRRALNGRIPAGVTIRTLPMEKAGIPEECKDNPGFILTNPPYGRRLGDTGEAETRYRDMGNLGSRFPGWKLGLICDHPGFESHFGRKADSCRELKNGAVDAYFYQYEKL